MGNQPSNYKPNNQQYVGKNKKHSPISSLQRDTGLTVPALISLPESNSMTGSFSMNTPVVSVSVSRNSRSNRISPTLTPIRVSGSLPPIPAPTSPPKAKISNEMMHINNVRSRRSKRDSIHNGIVGVYLSSETVRNALNFWTQNISNLAMSEELEIGCSIYFGMIALDPAIKRIFSSNEKVEIASVKFLNMMGYSIRYLMRNDINIYSSLKLLGAMHSKLGVSDRMYDLMLIAIHETFVYYFPYQYTLQIKNAINDVFAVISRIMTDREVANDMNIDYLENLDKCLVSLDGKSALFTYLKQRGCNSFVLFHELVRKFKANSNEMERFLIARDIARVHIDGIYGQSKKLNISEETAQNILVAMQQLNELWLRNMPFVINVNFFDDVEREANQLISKKYWKGFKQNIRLLQESL